ncbi:MAG: FAD:protein FMN transferase [Chloroflexota bacterium]
MTSDAFIPDAPRGLYRVEYIMGMPIGIDVRDPTVSGTALDAAFSLLRWVDATFSTYRADSAISRLNRGDLREDDAPPEVRAVLARCEELRDETGGYFDPRVSSVSRARVTGEMVLRPGDLDPSGLVKGWSVDQAAAILEAAGARAYAINAGGDIRVRGRPAPAGCWRIGIQHPLLRDKIAAVVAATDLAIATSGTYERGAHIVDPRTGSPPQGLLSVTIAGPDLATADAYATAAYAMGRAGLHWIARLAGYEAMLILAAETVLVTPAFPTAA